MAPQVEKRMPPRRLVLVSADEVPAETLRIEVRSASVIGTLLSLRSPSKADDATRCWPRVIFSIDSGSAGRPELRVGYPPRRGGGENPTGRSRTMREWILSLIAATLLVLGTGQAHALVLPN